MGTEPNDNDLDLLDKAPATVAMTGFIIALQKQGVTWPEIMEALEDNLASLSHLMATDAAFAVCRPSLDKAIH
jgi:hypothetical protein